MTSALTLAVVAILAAPGPLSLSLDEALQLAVAQAREIELARLGLEDADSRIEQAWGLVYPRVDVRARYTRNLNSPDLFAGSSAGGIFGALGSVDWLAFNEIARSDGDPTTEPMSLMAFRQRQAQGLSAAGLSAPSSGGNPFFVENQFNANLGLTQTLYSGAAFAAIRGARAFRAQSEAGIHSEIRVVVDRVTRAYYGALLAQASVEVLEKSVARLKDTLAEVRQRVARGVLPQFQQLSTEVELANLETRHLQAANQATNSLDGLKLLVALPVERPIHLSDPLALERQIDLEQTTLTSALRMARAQRPDLKQVSLAVQVQAVQTEIAQADSYPVASAFANLGLVGNVPDDRSSIASDPTDPFAFSQSEEGFFSDAYWDPVLNVGLSLSWNVFDGFGTTARVEESRLAERRARQVEAQLVAAVELEVQRALRDLDTAQRRLDTQAQIIDRAALNYDHAKVRVREGVSSQLELREASAQLDESRFNHLQAVHDYLIALAAFDAAVGNAPGGDTR